MIDLEKLKSVYKRYGFEHAKSGTDDVVVFTIQSGYYHNADIVPLKHTADSEAILSDFTKSGYACKTRSYASIDDVEKSLFEGYFTVSTTRKRLNKEYNKFIESVLSAYSDTARYSYIQSSYIINDRLGESNVVNEVRKKLKDKKAILFLIEAAAGFGKTCTAYEILNDIVTGDTNQIPLFSELHRNRQAKIFRYVLLDEIDRSFPSLSSSLVKSEILKGNVPVVLDGFDELLRTNEDGDGFENTEPMLETIGGLLQKKAKVILTTRRTAIFDGDEFHEWIESHSTDFDVIRIRLLEPTIHQWLDEDRIKSLQNIDFPIDRLSNPVLLSYLRCISKEDFESACLNPDEIVDTYFNFMLARESIRQDLLMPPADQYFVLQSIAADMMERNYTSSSRDDIVHFLNNNFRELVEKTRQTYSINSRPSADEVINKLTNHAMLDRSNDQSKEIGFVNEFVLGNFCSDVIIGDESSEWAGDSIFIEPAVISYQPRNNDKKLELLKSLQFSLEFQTASNKLEVHLALDDEIGYELDGVTIENLAISTSQFANSNFVSSSTFINCKFSEVEFHAENISTTSFINCDFYSCKLYSAPFSETVSLLACTDDNELLPKEHILDSISLEQEHQYTPTEIYILEKYLPVGREIAHKHRAIKGLCTKNNYHSHIEIISGIENLKKRHVLLSANKTSFLALNLNKIAEIKAILGRI